MIERKFIYYVVILLLGISCKERSNIIHMGENLSKCYHVEIDTTCVNIENSTGMGNFYFVDTVITFVDAINCTFYDMNLDGRLIASYFGKGRGKNEINVMLYAYPIENDSLNRGVIVDQNNLITIFDRKNKDILYCRKIDFNQVDKRHEQYRSSSLYKIAEFTALGMSFYLDSDSTLIFQVNVDKRRTRRPDRISNKRYEEGAILGKLNLSTMKVEEVIGKFPEIYKHKPMAHLEFFQYTIFNDLLYVDHAVDSLIYVYKYPDDLQYTIGYECLGIDRNYTSSKAIDYGDAFKNDFQHVGVNSGLIYCSENNTLCRTYVRNTGTGESGMQIYKNNDLIADVGMPAYFKLLGYRSGYYYGARLIPEEDMESTNLVLYKIKLDD